MLDPSCRRHGLEDLLPTLPGKSTGARLQVRLLPDLGQIGLRGDPGDKDYLALAQSALGQALPTQYNTISFGNYRIYWLGPDEWLILASSSEERALASSLKACLKDRHASVTEIGGANIVMTLTGSAARNLLARGSCIDFAADRFLPGQCAQTALTKSGVIIGLIDKQPTFEIIVRRSFSDYLVRWLNSAGRSEGIAFMSVRQSA